MSEVKPSEITGQYWIYAYRLKGKYAKESERSGKWLLFFPLSEIDEWWKVIKELTENGMLGQASKVATARPNDSASDPNTKVICVYTYDSDDYEDVKRVREVLRTLGITQKIPYKTDLATYMGLYQNKGKANISKYYE